jgi:hypothetical protein
MNSSLNASNSIAFGDLSFNDIVLIELPNYIYKHIYMFLYNIISWRKAQHNNNIASQ